MGYEDEPPPGRPKTLWVFPYDWTESCDDAGRELASFIAGTVIPSTSLVRDGVDIVNHSMGGVVTRAARQCQTARPSCARPISLPRTTERWEAYLALHPAIGLPIFDKGLDLILTALLKTASPLVLLQRQVVMWKSAYDMLPDDQMDGMIESRHGWFPASMQGEIRSARLQGEPATAAGLKHIVFTCNTKSRSRWGWRHLLPSLSFLGSKLSEDTVQYADAPLVADGMGDAANLGRWFARMAA